MARSAKTKHVLDLVGTEPAKKMVSPSLQELQGKSPPLLKPPTLTLAEEMSELTGLPAEEFGSPSPSPEPEPEPEPEQQEEQPSPDRGITFIVAELINQELETVVNRFNLTPTDSNLWELTRSVIETIRPEFARDEEEYLEKCEKLRPRVIKEMTKAAVRVAAKDKKNREL